MAEIREMLQWLINEVNIWIKKGIITPEQKEQILKLYKVPLQADRIGDNVAPRRKSPINLARVILVLAVICIAVGLVIFYAANWRKMPPGLKMAQVLLLIFSCYGVSWYLLFVKKEIFAGRLILMLGMVTFGIGIMLVAQIYHISSHPTNGLLVWAIGTLLLSAVMDEEWGYYMSLALFIIWDYWEVVEYGNPAYFFIIPLLIYGVLFYRRGNRTGLTLTATMILVYYFQINIHWIGPAVSANDLTKKAFMYMLYGLGPMLMIAAKLMRSDKTMNYSANILSITGWVVFLIPLLSLSWPFESTDPRALLSFPEGTRLQSTQFALFILISAAGCLYLRRKGENPLIFIPFTAIAVILFIVPDNTTARMVSTHTAIVILIASSLASAYTIPGDWNVEKAMAFVFTISIFIVKWIGLTASAFSDNEYMIAYLVGFIIFATVCFLINRLVNDLSGQTPYPSLILDVITSIAIWLTIYIASFKIEDQTSIFDADTVVIVMIFLFITLAVILYMALLSRLKEKRTIIYLSMIIFIASGLTLFIAGEGISWICYSVVFNLLLLIATGAAIYYSTIIQSRMLLNIAVCAFILHIGTRYFDLFWDMLSGSLLFIITGVIGLAGGYMLEKKRRQIISAFDSAEGDHE
jgi:uncharacterized membrane protein